MPAAGRTASSARARPVSTSRTTGSPARGRRRARHGVTAASTVPTPSRGRALPRFPARRTRFVCTCASNSPARRPPTGTMLRTIQQAGTDQVLLERVDNGTLVTRLTINQELAAGDTPAPARQGHDDRGVAQRRLELVTARRRHRLDLRRRWLHRHRPARDDRPPRGLRGAEPRPEPAPGRPPRSLRTAGDGSVSSLLDGAVVRRRLADHELQGVPRHERGRRDASSRTPATRRASSTRG